jgi:hypothetical protein
MSQIVMAQKMLFLYVIDTLIFFKVSYQAHNNNYLLILFIL